MFHCFERCKMKYRYFVFLIAVIFCIPIFHTISNANSIQIVLKGKVVDEFSGQPLSASIEIRTQVDKRFTIKTNPVDGSFSQVLNAGERYVLIFYNYDIIRQFDTIRTEEVAKYTEQEMTFEVKRLKPGLTIFSLNGFESGQSIMTDTLKKVIASMFEALRFNRCFKLKFTVNSHDTYFEKGLADPLPPDTSDKPKKGKIKTPKKKQTEAVADVQKPTGMTDMIKQLTDSRKAVLDSILNVNKGFQSRIQVECDYTLGPPAKDIYSSQIYYDFIISVTELKNLFE